MPERHIKKKLNENITLICGRVVASTGGLHDSSPTANACDGRFLYNYANLSPLPLPFFINIHYYHYYLSLFAIITVTILLTMGCTEG